MIMIITMVMMTMIMMNRMMIRLLEAKTGQRQDFDISHEQNDRDLAKIHIVHADNMFMQNLSLIDFDLLKMRIRPPVPE